jgi:hypothetical protein
MEKFNDIQSLWTKQVDASPPNDSNTLIKVANQKIKIIKRNHAGTIVILSATIAVLVYYYLWLFNVAISNRIIGLQLMIFVLFARVILEIISIIQFYKIDFTADFKNYTKQLMSFYKLRKAIHFILTPIIYISYIVGFASMLPLFKENFSTGFYIYILVSGFGFLILFSYFLLKVIKKDMKNLDVLKQLD